MVTLVMRNAAGEQVEIIGSDKGDAVPGYRKTRLGHFERFEAYTSHFCGPGWEEYVQVDKRKADKSGNVDAFREMHDKAALAARGLF